MPLSKSIIKVFGKSRAPNWHRKDVVAWLNEAADSDQLNYALIVRMLADGVRLENCFDPKTGVLSAQSIKELKEALATVTDFHSQLHRFAFKPSYQPYSKNEKITWTCTPDDPAISSALSARSKATFGLGRAVLAVLKLLTEGEGRRIRQCGHCMKWFVLPRADSKYCSPKCRLTHYANAADYNSRSAERMRAYRKNLKRKDQQNLKKALS